MPKTRISRTEPASDAIALLKADHRAVQDLFKSFEIARSGAKKKLADKICVELLVHTAIEEEVLYPALRGHAEDDLLDEAQVEHDGAKLLIAEILESTAIEPFFAAKVKVLSEMIKHHVKEEEQRGGLFAQAKASDLDLASLGEQMAERREALAQVFAKNGPPRPTVKSLRGAKVDYQSADAT